MKHLKPILISLLLPLTALAANAETIEGTNFWVSEAQSWRTSEDTGYWIAQHLLN